MGMGSGVLGLLVTTVLTGASYPLLRESSSMSSGMSR